MVKYPSQLDDDSTIPPVYNNVTEIGELVINAIREAIFSLESTVGTNAAGSMSSLGERVNVSIDDTGLIRPSSLIGIGLVALPITDAQISATAAIQESKLHLTYTTQFLHDLYTNLNTQVQVLNDWLSVTGVKVEPHLAGTSYRHELSHIDVDAGALNRVRIFNGDEITRNLSNAYNLVAEISNDLLYHTMADGITNTTVPPINQAHNASGIYIDPFYFITVPHTVSDLQKFAEYVDSSSLALLGSRTQNLYSNGIPRSSRATSMTNEAAGEAVLDPTNATTYLLHSAATSPVDDMDHGDDIIFLNPSDDVLSSNNFDAQFTQVKTGDYITVTYDDETPTVVFTIDSVKKFLNGTDRVYAVRINGKNLKESTTAIVRIDRPYYHDVKSNSLFVSQANNLFDRTPSLIINSPRGAGALGVGFSPTQFDTSHYNLYLALYPTGNPIENTLFLPPIDVTGNGGKTPGHYTLENIVFNINEAVRAPGFNYRFNAFDYKGNIGIGLADHYNDASFSIISGITDDNGMYDSDSNDGYENNVIDNYQGSDPLGLGLVGSNLASPPFSTSYSTPQSSLNAPTIIFAPTRRNFFYVDGVEKDNFALENFITRDGYGDGYWNAIITSRTSLSGRVEVEYEIDLDLSSSGLKIGKTLVVQPSFPITSGSYNLADYGRFTISNVIFNNCPGPDPVTIITVYDGVHGTGVSPSTSSVSIPVKLYFTDDSVSFNQSQVSDSSTNSSFKRLFEIYLDSDGNSCTHERARFDAAGNNITVDSAVGFVLYNNIELSSFDIIDISPKFRGYSVGQYKKVTLFISDYDATSGIFNGYLCNYIFPSTYNSVGLNIQGKKGEIVRFYDDTEVDYIDIRLDLDKNVGSFVSKQIDIQIYDSLELNQEKILVGKCQLEDINNVISVVKDTREFGNISEKQLSSSAINYITAPQRILAENGVIRGFDIISTSGGISNNSSEIITIHGGSALINGKIIEFNDGSIIVPNLTEVLYPSFTTVIDGSNNKWFICINSRGNFELIASTDYEISDAALYESLDHNRIKYVTNPSEESVLPYAIRSAYLHKIYFEMKDLLPIYVLDTFEGDGSDYLKILDIRRYVEKGFQGLGNPLVVSKEGSFRSISGVNNFINEITGKISYSITKKNNFGNHIYVRDTFDISDTDFNYKTPISFIGDGGAFVTNSDYANAANNVEFKNIRMSIPSQTGISISGDNVIIDSCEINYTYDATTNSNFVIANPCNTGTGCLLLNTGTYIDTANSGKRKNIQITNCKFTSEVTNRFPFITFIVNGSNDYLENINISNNQINTLSNSSSDDKRAVIAVVSNGAASSTENGLTGRIVNTKINNNICNKNQLIVLSGPNNGSKITNMLSPVNVSIEDNICGAICYAVRQDRARNTANTTRINDKNNLLKISGNNCRYIYCGTDFGFINIVGSSNRITYDYITGYNLVTAPTTITNNTCSWIHVGQKQSTIGTFSDSALEIDNNILSAYDPSFLLTYHSSITPLNIALIVDSTQGN